MRKKSVFEEKLAALQKQLLQLIHDAQGNRSLFEVREVLERYAGLTLAVNSIDKKEYPVEFEIFRIALRENSRIGVECLHRRNNRRLKFHQNLARKDFLKVIGELRPAISRADFLRQLAIEFTNFLDDVEACRQIEEIFAVNLQSGADLHVKNLEKEVWNPKEIKPQTSSQMPIRLKAFMASTSKKD